MRVTRGGNQNYHILASHINFNIWASSRHQSTAASRLQLHSAAGIRMEKWRYRRDDSRTVAIRAGHEPSRSFTFMGGRLLVYQGLNSRGFQKGEGPPPGSVKLNEGSLPAQVVTTFWGNLYYPAPPVTCTM